MWWVVVVWGGGWWSPLVVAVLWRRQREAGMASYFLSSFRPTTVQVDGRPCPSPQLPANGRQARWCARRPRASCLLADEVRQRRAEGRRLVSPAVRSPACCLPCASHTPVREVVVGGGEEAGSGRHEEGAGSQPCPPQLLRQPAAPAREATVPKVKRRGQGMAHEGRRQPQCGNGSAVLVVCFVIMPPAQPAAVPRPPREACVSLCPACLPCLSRVRGKRRHMKGRQEERCWRVDPSGKERAMSRWKGSARRVVLVSLPC